MRIGLVPVFNEEQSIVEVLNRLEKQLDYIIVVNDGSFDTTDFLISNWKGNKKNIHYISYGENKGMSCALFRGLRHIAGQHNEGKFSYDDIVVTIDADRQHEPEEIKNMCEYFNKNNLNVLIAERNMSCYPKYRVMGNKLLSLLASYLGKFGFKDIECGFKILKLSFITEFLKYCFGFRYSCAGEIGIAASLLGYRVDNSYKIKISHYRKRGPNFADLCINLMFYFAIFLRIKSTYILKSFPGQGILYLKHKRSLTHLQANKQSVLLGD